MPSLTFLTYGSDPAPEPPRRLRAGPFTLTFEHGDLRYVKFGEREVIRRIYAAVRDRNWVTIPGVISDLQITEEADRFLITYACEHRQNEIHFVWHARITGEINGTVRWSFEGEAKTTFLRNRIGLCVLHPIRKCSGERFRTLDFAGTTKDLSFPTFIAAEQPIAGLHDLAGLAQAIEPDVWTELRFVGDLFSTEDQRNWIDASFKTFGTPLQLPRPVEIKAGTPVYQSVELRLTKTAGLFAIAPLKDPPFVVPPLGGERRSTPQIPAKTLAPFTPQPPQGKTPSGGTPNEVTVTWRNVPMRRLPDLGLLTVSHDQPFVAAEIDRLSELNLSHLRADVKCAGDGRRVGLLPAVRSAGALGLPLELAIHLPPDVAVAGLSELRRELTRSRADVSRVLAFHDGQPSTTAAALAAVREHFGDLEVPVGAGTDFDLYQLNLQRPPADADFISWSMNPQVHAGDNRSIMETPEAAAQQVVSGQNYFPGIPLVVSPITLKPRRNPVATVPDSAIPPGELPSQVDPRQMTLFGAAWTLAMLAALTPSGLESLTFGETTGWRGVMETVGGSPLPANFPSEPGQVFPLWHVFFALSGIFQVSATTVSEPLQVAALVGADRAGRRRVLMANLAPEPVRVELGERASGSSRTLDASNVVRAMRDPKAFWRESGSSFAGTQRLDAHALTFIDLA